MIARYKVSFYMKMSIIRKPFFVAYVNATQEIEDIKREVARNYPDTYVKIVEDKRWKSSNPYR